MPRYLVLLRGVNVGGKSLIKMADLGVALVDDGFTDVKTYIQSGNVFVSTPSRSKGKVANAVSETIRRSFSLEVETVAFTKADWQGIVDDAPRWWGRDGVWRHYLLVLLPPFNMSGVMKSIGPAVEGFEFVEGGPGVVYSSVDLRKYSRSAIGKLAGKPIYKRITIRNFNTACKLRALFE